ncbi:MAG: PAS domain S-box protein [Desulfobacteraceae bacterium]|nr:MAG: PAS domain S-box protein [Desulfobacteraceae bacterium]
MNRFLLIFLKRYDPENKELFLKAKFVLITTLTVILTLSSILLYTSWLVGMDNIVVAAELTAFAIMLCALVMLIRGRYGMAIHTILITGFTTVWAILFMTPNISMLTNVDTIVFIIGLMAAMPLMFFKSRTPMVVYFGVNFLLFIGFNLYLKQVGNLSVKEHLDYFFDNATVMIFVFFISFTLFSIYQEALNRLKNELLEKKHTERALKESENRLWLHLQNTPIGAVSMDLNYVINGWNPAAEKIFGYTESQAVGSHITDLIIPEQSRHEVISVFEQLLSGSGGKRNINNNMTQSGQTIICDWYNTLIDNNDGEQIGIASLVNDITEQKKTEEMMIQTEKMMSVGGLAAGMAHEINNPLAGMMQSAQVIHQRLCKPLPSNMEAADKLGIQLSALRQYMEDRDILNHLDNIHQSGSHASKIIRNMLSFSQKGPTQKSLHHLEDLIDSTLELALNDYDLKTEYDFKKIRIVREVEPGLPAIACEKTKIQQVLFNIIKNASQAINQEMPDHPSPTITIRLRNRPGCIHIEIQDNGPGMDPDVRKRIFEPFFTTKDVDKGTGLGLSVSYFIIVDDHGGEMEVDSAPGKGTTFTLMLPLHPS